MAAERRCTERALVHINVLAFASGIFALLLWILLRFAALDFAALSLRVLTTTISSFCRIELVIIHLLVVGRVYNM